LVKSASEKYLESKGMRGLDFDQNNEEETICVDKNIPFCMNINICTMFMCVYIQKISVYVHVYVCMFAGKAVANMIS
jgi:hypothetical protein